MLENRKNMEKEMIINSRQITGEKKTLNDEKRWTMIKKKIWVLHPEHAMRNFLGEKGYKECKMAEK